MTDFYKDKKVFIAGGAGLIGQALIRLLVPMGAKVTATEFNSRKIDPEFANDIEIIRGIDLNKPTWDPNNYWTGHLHRCNVYAGSEIVFWAAAKVGGAKVIREDPMGLVHYNLELAARNIKAAVDAHVDRFCYVSSSYVYAEYGYQMPSVETETNAFDVPLQHYGLGWVKRFMEKLCKSHQLTSGTRFALVRPTAVYGPYDNFDLETCHVIPALVRKVAEKRNPLEVWGDGGEQRQFTFVDDLARGLLLATELNATADPINIATDQISRVDDVWQTLFEIDGVGTMRYLGDKPRAISSRTVGTDKCKMMLRHSCDTTLRVGVEKTLEWYRSHAER